MNRRTFIGGCVAAGVGAGLPNPAEPYYGFRTLGPSGPVTVTIPALAITSVNFASGKTLVRCKQGGRHIIVECKGVEDYGDDWIRIRCTGLVMEEHA